MLKLLAVEMTSPVSLLHSILSSFRRIFPLVNGNGYKLDGGGPYYWVRENRFRSCRTTNQLDIKDGKGLSGGKQKPDPMIQCVARSSGSILQDLIKLFQNKNVWHFHSTYPLTYGFSDLLKVS